MRRRKSGRYMTAWICITAGLIVLMSMILPDGFWWFMLGVALITAGICLKRWC